MKVYDHGDLYRVTVSAREVYDFNTHWPGSELEGPQSFMFEKKNGDLVSMIGKGGDGDSCAALMDDAKQWGMRQLNRKAAREEKRKR